MGKGLPRTVRASWSLVVPEVPRDPANLISPQPAQPSLALPFPTSWVGSPTRAPHPHRGPSPSISRRLPWKCSGGPSLLLPHTAEVGLIKLKLQEPQALGLSALGMGMEGGGGVGGRTTEVLAPARASDS